MAQSNWICRTWPHFSNNGLQFCCQNVVPKYVLTFIYFRPALYFIFVYNCGLTVRNKRMLCYVMLCHRSAATPQRTVLRSAPIAVRILWCLLITLLPLTRFLASSALCLFPLCSRSANMLCFSPLTTAPLRSIFAPLTCSGHSTRRSQHGVQQQMWAVSCCQLMYEAGQRLVIILTFLNSAYWITATDAF